MYLFRASGLDTRNGDFSRTDTRAANVSFDAVSRTGKLLYP